MVFDTMSIVAYAIGLLFLYIFCRIFIKPIKWLIRCLFSGIAGGIFLSVLNFVGGFAGVFVIINPLSALLSGFLGIPGVILVTILQYLLR